MSKKPTGLRESERLPDGWSACEPMRKQYHWIAIITTERHHPEAKNNKNLWIEWQWQRWGEKMLRRNKEMPSRNNILLAVKNHMFNWGTFGTLCNISYSTFSICCKKWLLNPDLNSSPDWSSVTKNMLRAAARGIAAPDSLRGCISRGQEVTFHSDNAIIV